MKLSIKLPVAFATGLAFMLAAALYGIYSLNQSLTSYGTVVQASNDNERAVNDLTLAFKMQVQEWKNTLLRGKEPKDGGRNNPLLRRAPRYPPSVPRACGFFVPPPIA